MPLKPAAHSRMSPWLLGLARALAAGATLLGGQRLGAVCWFGLWRRWPQDADALAALAYWRAQSARPLAALRWQRRWLVQQPHRAEAHFNLGFVLEQLGRWEAAQAAFARATELAPHLDLAWFGLARCLERLGHSEAALLAYGRNAELQPWSPHAHAALARMHAQQGRPQQALALIAHLRGFEPRVALSLEQELGALMHRPGRAPAAGEGA